ncbi:hypothetical protein OY671_008964, partial [Metschnikowia pulcherrima]
RASSCARWVREYPQGQSAAHVVGYIGRIAEGDIEELERAGQLGNYRGTDVIGKKGIEKTWEEASHGRTGSEEGEVTAGGRPMRTLRRIDPVPGSDIMSSIDSGSQKVAEEAFVGQRGALVAIDPDTGEVSAESLSPGEEVCVARGGRGGLGNTNFKSSTTRTPRHPQPGEEGEARTLDLELKLIADVGSVGFPNAGKSTSVSRLSAARPKIAEYPFTTSEPQLGVVSSDRFGGDSL